MKNLINFCCLLCLQRNLNKNPLGELDVNSHEFQIKMIPSSKSHLGGEQGG